MKPFALSVLIGFASSLLIGIGLWFSVPMLLSPIFATEKWVPWFPVLTVLPSLLAGGYVAAKRSPFMRHAAGALVGLFAMTLYLALGKTSGPLWFSVALAAGGSAVALFGALFGGKRIAT